MTTLVLPGTVPAHLKTLPDPHVDFLSALPGAITLERVLEHLEGIQPPDMVAGEDHLPAAWWAAIRQAFPDARCLMYSDDQWVDFETADIIRASEPKSGSPSQGQKHAAKQPSRTLPLDRQRDNELIRDGFKYASWGPDNADGQKKLLELRAEVSKRAARAPHLRKNFEASVKEGEFLASLKEQIQKEVNRGKPRETIRKWIESQAKGHHERVRKDALNKLEKSLAHREKAISASKRVSGIQRVRFEGHHPNSLPHLAPDQNWTFYVDETGKNHDLQSSGDMGRLVVVAVPGHVKLPPLKGGAHGVTDDVDEVDARARTLLEQPVGIFGFTIQDPNLRLYSWLTSVAQLVRWTALQTPVKGNSPVLHFVIENRGRWADTAQLDALRETLEAELRTLRPDTLGNLRLKLEFARKHDNSFLAYADTVAYTWGSKTRANKDRLQKTQWPGHCLLNQNSAGIARLLAPISTEQPLSPEDWYAFFDHPDAVTARSLVHDFLKKLGKAAAEAPSLWQRYLDYVMWRIRTKRYAPASLAAAIDWLDGSRPADRKSLPPAVELAWLSTRLASSNHLGQVQLDLASRTLKLARELADETHQQASEAVIRVLVSCTNAFEFKPALSMAQEWMQTHEHRMDRPIRGRMQSLTGQLHAFLGHYTEADTLFNQALDTFGGLSDPEERARECLQVQAYQIFNRLDQAEHEQAGAESVLHPLSRYIQGVTGLAVSGHKITDEQLERLAASGDELRYAQHLLVRVLAEHPYDTPDLRARYLTYQDQWQVGLGHPWPLIEAYRARLLQLEGQDYGGRLDNAIQALRAEPDQPTLLWMADALTLWGHVLGLTKHWLPGRVLTDWKERLPATPVERLQHWLTNIPGEAEATACLRSLLPFNFR